MFSRTGPVPRSIKLSSQAEKSFNKLKDPLRENIVNAINELSGNPLSGKKLRGKFEKEKLRSYRVWPCRIIYTFDADTLVVAEIGHRKGVYR